MNIKLLIATHKQTEMPKDYKTKDAEYSIQRLSISFTQMSDELTANI